MKCMELWETGLSGSVLIAVILLLRPLLHRRLPKWTFAALWWIAVLRLLIPVALPSRLSVYNLLDRQDVPRPVAAVETVPSAPAVLPVPALPAEEVPVPAAGKSVPWLEAVYLAGVLVVGSRFLLACRKCLRTFRDAVPPEAPLPEFWCENRRRPVPVRVCGGIDAPLAWGLFRPVVLFPARTDWAGAPEPLVCALFHEYAHIRRGDLWCKALLSAALSLHWYNPLVWLMFRFAGRDLELACDEAAVRALGTDRRKDYALALLHWAEAPNAVPLCQFNQPVIEERITAIMKLKKRTLPVLLAAVLLLGTVTVAFATSGAGEPPAEPDPSTPVQVLPTSPGGGAVDSSAAGAGSYDAAVWFAPADIYDVQRAELVWWDGATYPLRDPETLAALTEGLSAAEEIKPSACPFHSVLYLTRSDGVVGKVLPAEDSCAVFQSGGKYYDFSDAADSDNRGFYALFGVDIYALPRYTRAQADLAALRDSVAFHDGVFRFTIPEGGGAWSVHIAGRAAGVGGMSVHYLEDAEWTPGRSYEFSASEELYTELTLDAAVGNESMSVDLLPYMPPAGGGAEVSVLRLSWPVRGDNGAVSSGFGARATPGGQGETIHSGIDIPAPQGEAVLAAANGVVSETGFDAERGNYLVLDHGNGLATVYAHCRDFAVNAGDTVKQGEMIGAVGSTGQSTGPHLCFQVILNGEAQDPLAWLGMTAEAAEAVPAAAQEAASDGVDSGENVSPFSYAVYTTCTDPEPGSDKEPLYDIIIRGDADLVQKRGGTLLPDEPGVGYFGIGNGISYKLFATKNSTERCTFILYEYEVGNKNIIADEYLSLLDTLEDGEYPKNALGQSYGLIVLAGYVGYYPDLVAISREEFLRDGEAACIPLAEYFGLDQDPDYEGTAMSAALALSGWGREKYANLTPEDFPAQ